MIDAYGLELPPLDNQDDWRACRKTAFTAEGPAPHPMQRSRKRWLRKVSPRGPVGLLMQALVCINATVVSSLQITIDNEVPIHIMDTPFQAIAKHVTSRAQAARTMAIKRDKPQKQKPSEIDRKVAAAAEKRFRS